MAQSCKKEPCNNIMMCIPNVVQMPSVDYDKIRNKPQINNVILVGNLSSKDLSLYGLNNPETFVFKQEVASAEWNVEHNLNKFPACTIVSGDNEVILGDITYLDESNLIITFSEAISGACYLD